MHVVWATRERYPYLTPEVERAVYRCIHQETDELRCSILAIGGMPDHVHLLVKLPPTVSIAKLVKTIKGCTSNLMGGELYWQAGYGVFSISRSHVDRVVKYIKNQKQHHADGSFWPEWEETFTETDDPMAESLVRQDARPQVSQTRN